MKVFVTGATGFLGSHLVDLLLARGDEVSCLVRRSSNLRWLVNKPLCLTEGALLPDDPGLLKGVAGADWVFHAAGLVSSPDPQKYFDVNAGGTRYILEAIIKKAPHLKRFVLISSMAAVGPAKRGEKMGENALPNPLTVYGESKLEAERIALSYREKIPLTIIRPPAIYGPRDKMIFPVFQAAQNRRIFFYPAGRPQTVSMAHVEDVAAAAVWAAGTEKAAYQTYFVADGDLYRWQDIGDALSGILHHKVRKIPVLKSVMWPLAYLEEKKSKLLKQSPRLHRGHVRQFFRSWGLNTEKIEQDGFRPKFNLEEGMRSTVAGYRQLGWL